MIELLKGAVELKSEFPNEKEVASFWERALQVRGFEVERQYSSNNPDRFNLLAKRGRPGKYVMFYGHLDTVPLIDPDKWESNPYQLDERKGLIYGLGANDMKGGIASFVSAVEKAGSNVKIILGYDEENISEGAWQVVRERREFFEDVALIISAEPNLRNEMGLNEVALSRTGRQVYQVVFMGEPGHTTGYKPENDPIKKLVDFGEKFYLRTTELVRSEGGFARLSFIEGKPIGMSVSAKAVARIEVFYGLDDDTEVMRQMIQAFSTEEVAIPKRDTPYLKPYSFVSFPYRHIVDRVVRRNTGMPLKFYTRGGTVADDNVLATLGIPVATWGPKGGQAHAANEYVEKESLELISKMYAEFLLGVAHADNI